MENVYFHGNDNHIYSKLKIIIQNLSVCTSGEMEVIRKSIIFFEEFNSELSIPYDSDNTFVFILKNNQIKPLLNFSEDHFFFFIKIEDLDNDDLLKLHLNLIFKNHAKLVSDINKLKIMENKIFDLAFATTNILEKKEEMELLAIKDGLTHLYNHSFFKEQLNKIFSLAKTESKRFSIAILDLDYFKNVNDMFGHVAGDHVLKEFAKIILENVRKNDIVARYGGEEFAIIFPDATCKTSREILSRIRFSFNSHVFKAKGKTFRVTFSAGIAEYSNNFTDIYDMLKSADNALYESKHIGRNKTTIHCP